MLGLLVAFLGVYFGHQFHNPYLDGAASIVIGIILGVVAIALSHESKGLLVGETPTPRCWPASGPWPRPTRPWSGSARR